MFLGFANFYKRFIYNYFNIIILFTNLFKSSKVNKKINPLK